MADLEPIAPLNPTLPPTKGKDDRRKPGPETEKARRPPPNRGGGTKRRKDPDDPTHEVDEYA